METTEGPRVVAAERLLGGVVVEFADGRCAYFSAALLFSKLAESEELDERATQW